MNLPSQRHQANQVCRLISAVTLALGFASHTWAGFDEGMAAYQRNDYATALTEFRGEAAKGHANAQYNLGVAYANGQGVPRLKSVAYALYTLSASMTPSNATKATANREAIQAELTPAELEAGQALAREMAKPGNWGKALDDFVAQAEK